MRSKTMYKKNAIIKTSPRWPSGGIRVFLLGKVSAPPTQNTTRLLHPRRIRQLVERGIRSRSLIILLFSLALALSAGMANAQLQGITDNLSVSIVPRVPGPNQEVLVTLKSFATDLDRAEIAWFLDGKLQKQGSGLKSFQFTTGKVGDSSRLYITVITQTNQRIEESIVFRPAEVDILLAAHTYIPPFYKGGALPTSKSRLTLTAVPNFVTSNGTKIDPETLIYTWEKDRRVLGSLSGFGKRQLSIDAPRLFQNTTISVEVSSFSETLGARESISIEPQEPRIFFYEKHPLEGVRYENALVENFLLRNEEVVVRAEPYFFSTENLGSGQLEFEWRVNNKRIIAPENEQEIVLRREENVAGRSKISLEIQNLSRILQRAVDTFFINF